MRRLATATSAALCAATALLSPGSTASAASASAQVVLCHGQRATVIGTPGHDVLVGTRGDDVIAGLSGDDRIVGGTGDDQVCGNGGDDVLYGGAGDDRLMGGPGDDTVPYSAGDDTVDGGLGHGDTISYEHAPAAVRVDIRSHSVRIGPERDTIGTFENFFLSRYDDSYEGGSGIDAVDGRRGDDVLDGRAGSDDLRGGVGDDVIDGGDGLDDLAGDAGSDRLTDMRGQNLFVDGVPDHHDRPGVIRAGPGKDTVWLYAGTYSANTGGGDDTLRLMGDHGGSSVLAGPGDDVALFAGGSGHSAMTLKMQDGDDRVECIRAGCGADDQVFGGPGRNVLSTGTTHSDETVVLGPFGSLLIHGQTDRSVSIFDFLDVVTGPGDDDVTGTDAANAITTFGGDDTVTALGGDDTISAGDGDDTVDAGDGNDSCFEVESPTSCEVTGKRG